MDSSADFLTSRNPNSVTSSVNDGSMPSKTYAQRPITNSLRCLSVPRYFSAS